MANIRRKNNQFQVRLTVKGKSISATFPTREAATAWAVATRQELLLGKHADVERARRHTFGQLLDRYSEKITPMKRGQRQEMQRSFAPRPRLMPVASALPCNGRLPLS